MGAIVCGVVNAKNKMGGYVGKIYFPAEVTRRTRHLPPSIPPSEKQ